MRKSYKIGEVANILGVSTDTIRYYDADGVGRATSEALALDIVRRSQLPLRYTDGTIVVANGATTEPMRATIA